MKNKMLNGLLLLGICFVVMGCPDDDDNSMNSDDQTAENLEQLVEGEDWEVTYFFDTDSDETSDFNGYSFSFNDNGTLVATNGANTVEGTWSISDDSNSSDDDDGSSDDVDFNIFFNVSQDSDFEDLNDDWDVILINSNKIELIDVSGGNGGTDYLTFER